MPGNEGGPEGGGYDEFEGGGYDGFEGGGYDDSPEKPELGAPGYDGEALDEYDGSAGPPGYDDCRLGDE